MDPGEFNPPDAVGIGVEEALDDGVCQTGLATTTWARQRDEVWRPRG
jgi:hypothetical protein